MDITTRLQLRAGLLCRFLCGARACGLWSVPSPDQHGGDPCGSLATITFTLQR